MKYLVWAILLVAACAEPAHHQPDAVLRHSFATNRSHFIAVSRIFETNAKLGVLDERGFLISHEARFPPPDLVVAEPYRTSYRQVLKQLGVRSVVRRYDGTIAFIMSESGTLENHSAKGFEYSRRATVPVVASLDSVQLNCEEMYYSVVEPNWYLYLQSYCS